MQAAGGTWWIVVRVVERIEEIGCKANIEPLFDLEVLVKREVVVPPAWADDIVSVVGVVKSTEGGVVARSICQGNGELAFKVASAVRASRPHGRRNKSALDIGRGRNVEIAGKPLPVSIAAARNV